MSLSTLVRRCPPHIRHEVDTEWATERGNSASQLASVQDILASKRFSHGTGRLEVDLTQRNKTILTMPDLSVGFKNFMRIYNRSHAEQYRFVPS